MTATIKTDLAKAALRYAEMGWRLYPIQPRSKRPLIADWPRKATNDPAIIEGWWRRWPNANVGVATGDLMVLDVDAEGMDAWRDLLAQHGQAIGETATAETPRGGLHLLYRTNGRVIRNSAGQLAQGIDVRGQGGGFVAPPSIHPNGRAYIWALDYAPWEREIADLPDALARLLTEAERKRAEPLPEIIPEGQRNATLASLAGTMRRRGASEDAILAALVTENVARCDPPLPDSELAGIAASVARYTPGRLLEPDAPVPIHASDMGLGRRFAILHRDRARYVRQWGWTIFTGRHWERDRLAAMRLAGEVVKSIYTEAGQATTKSEREGLARHALTSESLRVRNAMLGSAQSEPEMKADTEDFDTGAWLFNCATGTLDLRTGALRPHHPGDMLTRCAPVSFDGDADLGHWKRHIEYFLPNADVRRYVQRQLGRSLVGGHLSDDLPIWHGEGSNGRSTTAKALHKVLGDYCQAAAPRLLLASRHERHPTELADLYGSRLVFSIEIDEGSRLAESLAKQLTGGDRIKGRYMRQDFFSFDPTWTIVLVVNHKPQIRSGGHAIWRRIKLVPWTTIIPEAEQRAQDEVVAELVADGPAILRWLLDGLADWQADHHWCPDEVIVATAAYRAEQDTFARWVDDCAMLKENAWSATDALRASYKGWGTDNGVDENRLLYGQKWGDALKAVGCSQDTRRVGGKKKRGWQGIGLLAGTDGTDLPGSPLSTPTTTRNGGNRVPSVPLELVDDEGKEIPF